MSQKTIRFAARLLDTLEYLVCPQYIQIHSGNPVFDRLNISSSNKIEIKLTKTDPKFKVLNLPVMDVEVFDHY